MPSVLSIHVRRSILTIRFRIQRAVVLPIDLGIWWTCSTPILVSQVCEGQFYKAGASDICYTRTFYSGISWFD
jgi:hypothetical protein